MRRESECTTDHRITERGTLSVISMHAEVLNGRLLSDFRTAWTGHWMQAQMKRRG